MKFAATFLLAASAASLLGCGKSEDSPAAPPAVEAPQAAATADPIVEAPQSEVAPTALPETSLAPPETKLAQPAAVSPPVAAKPTETSPAKPNPAAGIASETGSPDLAHGQKIYRQACAFCHDKGVAGAPKTGDDAAWSPRLAQGMDTLYAVSLRGKGAMPAKGGNPSLADADVKAAVDYMVAQSR